MQRVGKFLLKKVEEYLKPKYDRVYLVPESPNESRELGEDSYEDDLQYHKSNQKLLSYYKKLGYMELKNTYHIIGLDATTNEWHSIAIFLPVLYKDLK